METKFPIFCALCFFLAIGCSSSAPEEGELAKKIQKLEKELPKLRNYQKYLSKVQGYLLVASNEKERQKLRSLMELANQKLQQHQQKVFNHLKTEVQELVKAGKISQALEQLEPIPPVLLKSPYVLKIVQLRKKIKQEQFAFRYANALFPKVESYLKTRQYSIALGLLNAYSKVISSIPSSIQKKMDLFRSEIRQNLEKYNRFLAKFRSLRWYSAINPDDLYNWDLAPSSAWQQQKRTIIADATGTEERVISALSVIAKDRHGVDTIEAEEMKTYIGKLRFRIKKGSGFRFLVRLIKQNQSFTEFSITTADFPSGVWHTLRWEVEGDRVLVFSSTASFSQAKEAANSAGSIGFWLYDNSVVEFRDIELKVAELEGEEVESGGGESSQK
ncbi:MAG: hypothetical protein D6805_01340 [Planctomycetota bacterium]|nr:MAG: hypothetical protein D6805_01340 [Planctomycetota bacterium]